MKTDQDEMTEDPKKYLCERCRKFFSFGDIKYIVKGPDSKVALCSKCRAQSTVEASKIKEKKAEEKVPYICGRCKYKFKYDKSSGAALKCPYCGKNDKMMVDKVSDINKLINESD
jgi:DNA-directed RNA polymerase subunit RPC12/RpoP